MKVSKALRLKKLLKSGKKVNLGDSFDYWQSLAEAMDEITRWEAREKIAGQSVRESDLQHSYKTALLAISCGVMENARRTDCNKLDMGLLAAMGLVHDISEIKKGDEAHFKKIKHEAKARQAEIDAFREIIDPLPEEVREYFSWVVRQSMPKAKDFIESKEARFFNAIENVGYLKRSLYECRLGNLHFAPKCFEGIISSLCEHAKEFPSLKAHYEPYIEEAERYLKEFQKHRNKYVRSFVRNGGKKEDFPF